MNPRLVKFAVDLQNVEKNEKKEETKYFSSPTKKFFNFLKPAKVTVVVDNIQ